MDNNRAEEIAARLKQRKVAGECPMCGNHRFSVNGTGTQELENRAEGLRGILEKLNGTGEFGPIPVVITVCTNCGFIARYSLSVLGLQEQKEEYVK